MKHNQKNIFVFETFLFIIILFFYYVVLNTSDETSIFVNIRFVSILGLLLISYILISWKKVYYRLFSPYIIVITTLYLTLCGQSFIWAFNLSSGYRDLRYSVYGTISFSDYQLCKGLLYAYLCILTTHFSVLKSVDYRTKKTKNTIKLSLYSQNKKFLAEIPNSVNNKNLYKTILYYGFILIVISFIPYIRTFIVQHEIIRSSGYGAQYESVNYGLSSLESKISEFLPVGIITILYVWGKKNEFNKNNFIWKVIFAYFMVVFYLSFELRLGQRTGVILFCFSILFVYFSDKMIPSKIIIIGAVVGMILMAFMRMIDLLRVGNITISLIEIISKMFDYSNNPIFDFVRDIGWNLMTTVEIQRLIPSTKPFSYGISYIISLTSIIPNLNFWPVHPANLYGNISSWLQNYLGFSFGVGFTPVAEAYYNFGDIGFLFFWVWGRFCVYLNRKFDTQKNILDNYEVVLFMGILLKSFVRSNFNAFFRPYIYYILIPIFVIKILYQNNKKQINAAKKESLA